MDHFTEFDDCKQVFLYPQPPIDLFSQYEKMAACMRSSPVMLPSRTSIFFIEVLIQFLSMQYKWFAPRRNN